MVNLLQKTYSKKLSSNTSSVTSGKNPHRDIGKKRPFFSLSCLLLQSPLHGYPQGLSIWKNLTKILHPHFIWKSFRVTFSKDLPNYNIPSNCETIGIQTIFCSKFLTLRTSSERIDCPSLCGLGIQTISFYGKSNSCKELSLSKTYLTSQHHSIQAPVT
jgi:hypothetical protein